MKQFEKKHFSILLLLIAIGILSFWVYNRKNTWFHNPEEPVFECYKEPSSILLTFGKELNERIVTWQYDSVPTTGTVELILGTDTTLFPAKATPFTSKGGTSVYYQATLHPLESGKSYQYRILHPFQQSRTFNFQTPDKSREKFSFIYLGDVQDTIGGNFGEIAKQIMKREPLSEFYLFGGDVIERPHHRYWKKFITDMDSIARRVPIIAVPGNHEYLKGVPNKLEKRFIEVFPYFESSAGKRNHVFSFCYQNAQFFLLDSNSDVWNLPSQRNWLKKELKASKAKWKIVVLHHPIFSIRSKWNNLFIRFLINPLLKEFDVDLVLQGHEHGYGRKGEANNRPIYIISHCSPKIYTHKTRENMDVYDNNGRFYHKVEIGAATLLFETFHEDGTLKEAIVIQK